MKLFKIFTQINWQLIFDFLILLMVNIISMKNDTIRKSIIKQRLIEEIEASKLPLYKIAEQVGCSSSMLSQYKSTNKLPSLVMLAKICEVIGADANYILGILVD